MARIDTQRNLKRKRRINATMLRDANKSAAKDNIKLKTRAEMEVFFKSKKKS